MAQMGRFYKMGLAAIVVVTACCIAFFLRKGPATLETQKQLYMQVIARLRSGKIAVGPDGITTLPRDLRRASVGGDVYVSMLPGGQLRVAFKTWLGRQRNMTGFLYCSKPLTPPDITKDYYGNSVVQVGPVDLTIEEQIDENWYKVSYTLD